MPKKNPGATNLAQYVQAAVEHTRGAHDEGGRIIHETPKAKRREFAREIAFRKGYRNPDMPAAKIDWSKADPKKRRIITKLHGLAVKAAKKADLPAYNRHTETMRMLEREILQEQQKKNGRRNSVASTILEQLGGSKFSTMTGAKNFVSDGNSLRFKLPANFARRGINLVRITLDPSDTYTLEFMKLRGTSVQRVSERSGVHADQLRKVFVNETGLDVSLGTMRNPDPADALYKTFHGRGPDKTKILDIEMADPYAKYPSLTQLGKLLSLTVGEYIDKFEGREGEIPKAGHPDAWACTINFSESEAPDLAAEPGGRQLFIVGGNQNIDKYLSTLRADAGKDLIDAGFVYRIEYFTRKNFDGFRPVNYWHHFGEDTKVQPRLVIDRKNHLLQLVGGEYIVKREGIVN